jgi:hypothetical protein
MWKRITFTFSRPLKDQEERLFIAYFKRVTEGMRGTIKAGVSAYNNPVLQGAAMITGTKVIAEGVRMQMQFVLDNLYQYARLESEDKTTYHFRVQENALQIRAPAGQTINLWERFQKKFALKFKLEVCKGLGFMPGDLKISYGEESEQEKGGST